jgi:hypothetical protein
MIRRKGRGGRRRKEGRKGREGKRHTSTSPQGVQPISPTNY